MIAIGGIIAALRIVLTSSFCRQGQQVPQAGGQQRHAAKASVDQSGSLANARPRHRLVQHAGR
jgi:hypothetical protein